MSFFFKMPAVNSVSDFSFFTVERAIKTETDTRTSHRMLHLLHSMPVICSTWIQNCPRFFIDSIPYSQLTFALCQSRNLDFCSPHSNYLSTTLSSKTISLGRRLSRLPLSSLHFYHSPCPTKPFRFKGALAACWKSGIWLCCCACNRTERHRWQLNRKVSHSQYYLKI